jgi:hypothetical protein
MRALSLGAGVQSSALLLESIDRGDPPDLAIFADTGAEPAPVYRHLELLERISSVPIVRVYAGANLADELLAGGGRRGFADIPLYVASPRGRSMMRRQCTRLYKVRPIRAELRRRVGRTRAAWAQVWLGISTDEVQRVRPSDVQWLEHRWPLIEWGWSRDDCAAYLERRGITAPRSACTFCPFRRTDEWRWLRDHDPAGFAQAVAVDHAIRDLPRIDGAAYLHGSLQPLEQVDLGRERPDLWGEECTGRCGV